MSSVTPSFLVALQHKLDSMPPARAMGFQAAHCDAESLRLSGPLAANVNDKGCAFGGSLAGLLTLSAWGLVNLRLAEAGFGDAEVYVQDSTLRYLAPLYGDLHADARLAPGQSWDEFLATFRSRGKARATLEAVVALPDGTPATTLEGRFVALRPKV
jgi:thioesterase domain-containing protein